MFHHRSQYGEVYVTLLPDGREVPWKPLSYGDFLYYSRLKKEEQIPEYVIDDEIFKKCVVSEPILNNFNSLKAGVVSTVADSILAHSGPNSVELFNDMLDLKRAEIATAFDELAIFVCSYFPAYTPDDIYAMDFNTVLKRVAQAESIMLARNPQAQPLFLYSEENIDQQPAQKPVPQELKKIWEQGMKDYNIPSDKPIEKKREPRTRQEKQEAARAAYKAQKEGTSNAPTYEELIDMAAQAPQNPGLPEPVEDLDPTKSKALQRRINMRALAKDVRASAASDAAAPTGWERIDAPLLEHKMKSDAQWVFADLIKGLQEEKQNKEK